jgi:hypothetical protein
MANQTAPEWCPNAIATGRGWENEETGELYVSDNSLTVESPKVATLAVPKQVKEVIKKKKKSFFSK